MADVCGCYVVLFIGSSGHQGRRLSAAAPASTEESVVLDLPPGAELLQSPGSSQLVYLAQDRLHLLFVA